MFGQILSRGRAVVDLFAMLVSHAYIARRSRSTVARFINEESWTNSPRCRLFEIAFDLRGEDSNIYIFIPRFFVKLSLSCDSWKFARSFNIVYNVIRVTYILQIFIRRQILFVSRLNFERKDS